MKRSEKSATRTRNFGMRLTLPELIPAARVAVVAAALVLAACAGADGSNLRPGASTLPEVIASMGEPAMRWREADGREQLAYPRGPAGTQTYMAFMRSDGRLDRVEPVLTLRNFALIQSGKSGKEDVLKILGPSQPQWTQYFPARDELVWEWRICDAWNQKAFFDVLFDATTGIVRSSYQRPDTSSGGGDNGGTPGCSHPRT
jgi:hypothetical protein